MRATLCFVLLAVAAALPWQNDGESIDAAHKQRDVNRLLYKVTEPIRSRFTDLKDAAENYHPEDHGDSFTDGGAAAKTLSQEIKDHRTLEQHHFFSLFNNRHREEALMLFEVLLHAKSWSAFANSAAYYRHHLNEGVFVYGLYVAVIHSDLGQGVVLPPLYEITPHMFTNSEIIQQAYSAKMMQTPGKFKMTFTGSQRNPEQRVAYFGEDIGLGVHHVTWHMDFPFWWKDSYGYKLDRKGELFFWVHHQLTARFEAERLSNHLNVVDELYWDRPIYEGFAPHTTYKYGGEFPARPDNIRFEDVDGVARIRDMLVYENRIRDAIAHGYVTDKAGKTIDIRNEHGIDILGDVIESSEYSPNSQYYGALHNLAHIILGRQGDPHGKFAEPPGVMEHFETATRDPAFFRLHKYMDNIFKEHKDSLPVYTSDDISFPGVAVTSVGVSRKLETFFEDFEFDISQGVDDTEKLEDIELKAIVSRLNHEPFNYEVDVQNNNDADVLATVRIFLCPTKDANGITYTWETGRWGCVETDKFWQTLTPGENHIVHSSEASSVSVPDIPSFQALSDKTEAAISSGSELDLHEFSTGCGIPNRLLIPKGSPEGMEFDLLVVLSDGTKDAAIEGLEKGDYGSHAHCGIHGETYPDKRPMGYPLDRKIPDERIFESAANMKYVYLKIFHRE